MANPFELSADQTINFPQSANPLLQSLLAVNQAYQEQTAKTDESSDRMMEQIGVLFQRMNEEIKTSRTLAIQWESRYRELEVTSQGKIAAERSLVIDEVSGLKKLVTEKMNQSQDAIDALQKEVKNLKEQHVEDQNEISDLKKEVSELKAHCESEELAQTQYNVSQCNIVGTNCDSILDLYDLFHKLDAFAKNVDNRVTVVNNRVTTVNNSVVALNTRYACHTHNCTKRGLSGPV